LTRAAIPSEGTIATLPHYQTVNNNCTLEEVFRFVQLTFSEACVLSLEGGERKKPPMVRHFKKEGESQSLPTLETIRTLVCKGQWNLLRENDDFQTIAAALPNLVEWHGSYAKPKSKSYLCMATILPRLPENLTNLHLVLENDFRREAVCPSFFRKVAQKTHFCVDMAKAMPALEHFEYTGRVCQAFFDIAASLSSVKVRDSRLKSIDLVVKNVCRPTFQWNDGSGITDMGFILSFEALVLSAVRALDRLTALETLKIRFIDLGKGLRAAFAQHKRYAMIKTNKFQILLFQAGTHISSSRTMNVRASGVIQLWIRLPKQDQEHYLSKNRIVRET